MNTPICDFVKKYAAAQHSRLHMPGHKGKGFLGVEHLDITEVEGADVLYNAKGIIKESMENASSLFSTARTLYSTEGSSLSIRAMLYLLKLYSAENNRKPVILAGRNAHKAFLSGVALNDIEVDWIYPDESEGLLSLNLTPEKLKSYLENYKEKPVALYITSPDYLGNITDIKGLSAVCKEQGLLLLIDNAHGAYLNFLPENQHPIALGADICCDSAHKTLPVLTGGGYLHISKSAPEIFKTHCESAMSLFASTSPSYLILESLDSANKYMAEGYKEKLSFFVEEVEDLKKALKAKGYTLFGNEALKITISSKEYGYTGNELTSILSENGIICEFADSDFLTLMFTPENSNSDLNKLKGVLLAVNKRPEISTPSPKVNKLRRALSIKEALFSPNTEIHAKDAEGKILASYTVSCPPAVPIAICGEVIDENALKAFAYYKIEKIRVIK
ncbi:MAG: aminotransferase class V-fold PLP-dependent enzyme [Clostridia bacterium]|nr:aminotransferase class V-fold PLP-dependent enzyme [Clostridia bacterium]